MNERATILLLFTSSILNILFFFLGILFVIKKGGFRYLSKKVSHHKSQKEYYNPYYLHKKSQFELLPKSDLDIIFLGDSLTEEGQWSELLENPNIKNRGIGGDTTDLILNRLDTILASKPKKIFLMVGINDLLGIGKAVKTIEQIILVYSAILTEFQNKLPNTEVFIQSVLPVNNKTTRYWQDNNNILQLNLHLKNLAKEFSYQYIDVYSHLSDSAHKLDICYTEDGLHLNGRGYLKWKKAVAKYVNDTCIKVSETISTEDIFR
ncbi:GDSL-type esterase/lipase family protein [Scytonema sp. PRP1]|uniref:GDSL-type esterase/lipase family protein n=1 Tax=Scytonema sp. PRP1 TaxID=3120513 RepID=UPI002FD32AA3